MTYIKKYLFVLCAMLRVERDKGTFCYVNEVTGNAPENLKGELVARGSNQVIRGLELSVPPLRLWGGEKGWRLSQ